jgi:hypothetical protein
MRHSRRPPSALQPPNSGHLRRTKKKPQPQKLILMPKNSFLMPQKSILMPQNSFLMPQLNFGFKTKNLGGKVNPFWDFYHPKSRRIYVKNQRKNQKTRSKARSIKKKKKIKPTGAKPIKKIKK